MGRKKKKNYPRRENNRSTISFPQEYNDQIKTFCEVNKISRVDFVKLSIEKVCGSPASPRRSSRSISAYAESIEAIRENTGKNLDLTASLMAEITTIKEEIRSRENGASPLPNPVADTTNLIKVPALSKLKTRIAAGQPLTPAERLYCIANLLCPQCGNPLREKSTYDGQKFIGCDTKNTTGRFSCCTFSGDANMWAPLRQFFKEEEDL